MRRQVVALELAGDEPRGQGRDQVGGGHDRQSRKELWHRHCHMPLVSEPLQLLIDDPGKIAPGRHDQVLGAQVGLEGDPLGEQRVLSNGNNGLQSK